MIPNNDTHFNPATYIYSIEKQTYADSYTVLFETNNMDEAKDALDQYKKINPSDKIILVETKQN